MRYCRTLLRSARQVVQAPGSLQPVSEGGHYHSRFTEPWLEKGLGCFAEALALEPMYAQAHAGIGNALIARATMGNAAPHTLMPKAKEAALKALAIDDKEALAHTVLAQVLDYSEWNWAEAEREYRRALELNPGEGLARGGFVQFLCQLGRCDEAIAEARSGLLRDPVDGLSHCNLAFALTQAGRFDAAIAQAQTGIELDPAYPLLHLGLGLGMAGSGRYDQAVEAFRVWVSAAPGDHQGQAFLGYALGLGGQKAEALTILDHLERRREEGYVASGLLAYVRIGLGDYEQAISHLQQAAEERDGQIGYLKVAFGFDPLRSDPRFQALLRKMNFL